MPGGVLTSGDEEKVFQAAVNQIALATAATMVARDVDPAACYATLRAVALDAPGVIVSFTDAADQRAADRLQTSIIDDLLNKIHFED